MADTDTANPRTILPNIYNRNSETNFTIALYTIIKIEEEQISLKK
jgi:hypothetical protein